MFGPGNFFGNVQPLNTPWLLLANIRLPWKNLPFTNTPAYFASTVRDKEKTLLKFESQVAPLASLAIEQHALYANAGKQLI